jgi:hypothetical protein
MLPAVQPSAANPMPSFKFGIKLIRVIKIAYRRIVFLARLTGQPASMPKICLQENNPGIAKIGRDLITQNSLLYVGKYQKVDATVIVRCQSLQILFHVVPSMLQRGRVGLSIQ